MMAAKAKISDSGYMETPANVYVGNWVRTKWGDWFQVEELPKEFPSQFELCGEIIRTSSPAVKLKDFDGYSDLPQGWLPTFYICQINYGTKRPK